MAITNNSINSVIIGQASKSAFGEMLTAAPTPIIQLLFTYDLNPLFTSSVVTGSGTVTHSGNMAICSTTAATSSSATLNSKFSLNYQPGQGGVFVFTTIFTTGVAGSTQISGLGNSTDGYFFGYNGASFGILHRNNSSDNWIAQATWNANTMASLNPTRGNVYKIQYQWLGFGAINFYIEDSENGQFVLVHQIKYANANTSTSVVNPSLNCMLQVTNTSNNTNIVARTPSWGAYIEGISSNINYSRFSTGNNKNVTSLVNIFSIKNLTTFKGVANRKVAVIDLLTIFNGAAATNDSIVFAYLNPTLGGSPSYGSINANSTCNVDIAGTTITGGTELFRIFVAGTNTVAVPLTDYYLRLAPDDVITIGAVSVSGTAGIYASLSWQERF